MGHGPQVVLTSAGPDRTAGTADDIEVFTGGGGRSTHILSYEGSDHSPHGDFEAYVKTQDP